MTDEQPVVYLMRGLPACGKSHMARRLSGESGVICETDEYFYQHVGDDPTRYDYRDELLADARRWNFARFAQAVRDRRTPIVVDRGNGLNVETREYVLHAFQHGYRVELKEPDSQWWQELRVLLKYKKYVASEVFDRWAEALADASRNTHRVPLATIRRWMQAWKADITVDDILNLEDSIGRQALRRRDDPRLRHDRFLPAGWRQGERQRQEIGPPNGRHGPVPRRICDRRPGHNSGSTMDSRL